MITIKYRLLTNADGSKYYEPLENFPENAMKIEFHNDEYLIHFKEDLTDLTVGA